MYSHTKKVGRVGRYGPRIGRKLREEIRKMEDKQKVTKCPDCGKKITRETRGIWECRSCGVKLAGGAYTPDTRRR